MFISKTKYKSKKGFALIEIIIVMGISAILFGFVAFNLVRFQGQNSSSSNINSLISDIRSQQLKAMSGSTEGRSTNDSYGIYFLSDRYILFHGTTYNASEAANFSVELPENIRIQNTTFPSNTIVFNKLSGEISGYALGADSVTVSEESINEQTVITFNRYGVITAID